MNSTTKQLAREIFLKCVSREMLISRYDTWEEMIEDCFDIAEMYTLAAKEKSRTKRCKP